MELSRLYEREIKVVGPSHSVPSFLGPSVRRLNYAANQPSRFRRTRTHLGGTADAHYAAEFRFWELREYARDMDRNDLIVGQMIDRAVENILGPGLQLHPTTGDPKLDLELWERWDEWSSTPSLCDLAKKRPFSELARLGLRHVFIDGDSFGVVRQGPESPIVQFLEGDRCSSPDNLADDIIHGIELNYDTDEVLAYLFTKALPGTRKQHIRRTPLSKDSADVIRIPAFNSEGDPNVLHLYRPKRLTQTRGVTSLAPCFDILGMFEDVQLAKVVQQQMVSCVAAFITREHDYQLGNRERQNNEDGTEKVLEELAPGLIMRLRTGEKLESFNPNVPNPEFFHHVRLMIRLIGGNVGMPLELVLLDTTDTTFHGYRGVLQQARKGFEVVQKRFPQMLHTPVYKACLRRWLPELGIRTKKLKRKLASHYWQAPGWPYVDPKTEAEADKIRLKNGMVSPRRYHMEQGNDWDDVKRELVEDYGSAIELAVAEAERLNTKFKAALKEQPQITWREILHLDNPTGNTRAVKEQEELDGGSEAGAAGKPKRPGVQPA